MTLNNVSRVALSTEIFTKFEVSQPIRSWDNIFTADTLRTSLCDLDLWRYDLERLQYIGCNSLPNLSEIEQFAAQL